MPFRIETIKHHTEETTCEHCGAPRYVGDRVVIDQARGRAYCCRRHAEADRKTVPMPAGFDTAA
jgi:hypothetical protein